MAKLKFGWSEKTYSEDKPIILSGQFHARVSKGIHDPLMINALAIDDGKDSVVFVSADTAIIYNGSIEAIREKVAARCPDFDGMKIVLNATHTHTAPDMDGGYGLAYCEDAGITDWHESFDHFNDVVADCVCEAWENRASGTYAYGYGYAVVAHSRRVIYFDDVSKRPGAVNNSTHGVNGTAVMYGNTNDDNFASYEAGADHFVNLLYTFDDKDDLTGAIINVPCPSQNSESEYWQSADYWSDVRDAIHAKHPGIHIVTQCAAAGDLSPRILHYKQAQARRFALKYGIDTAAANRSNETELSARKDIAERIAAAFEEVLSWAQKDKRSEGSLTHAVKNIRLSRRPLNEEQYKAAIAGKKAACEIPFKTDGTPAERVYENSMNQSNRDRYNCIIERYEAQQTDKKVDMELHCVALDDIAFVTNKYELYMDFEHRMQARSPFEQTFIVQLVAQPGRGGGTYLATERGFKGRGYSASIYCNEVSYEGGQELVEESVKLLKEIHG